MADTEVRGILSANEYRRPQFRLVHAGCALLALVLAFIMIYPVLWVLLSSVKTPAEIYRSPPTLFPSVFDWQNFIQAWKSSEIPWMFLNTTLVFFRFVVSRLGPALFRL